MKINLGLLKKNYEKLKLLSGSRQILFMVKANAYGHGMVPIVRYAVSELGIKEFGCATVGEALTLRKELCDLKFDIYVFSDLELDAENGMMNYIEHGIIPVISCQEVLHEFLQESRYQFLPVCLKFNTGMNRLGFKTSEVGDVINELKKFKKNTIYHLMSHFSCSSESVNKNLKSQKQYAQFQEIKKVFIKEGFTLERTSMANSGAIEQGFALEETHIRPGLILYGPSSLIPSLRKKRGWQGETISSLETHIIQIQKIKKGDPVGYGATPCPEEGFIAYIALGYGDGLTNFYRGIKISHKGFTGTVVGRISMDMTAVLFPLEAEKVLVLGESILLWNHDSDSVLSISDHISSIPYEIFCGLSERIPRVYSIS